MPKYEVQVPASNSDVRSFLKEERDRFIKDLKTIRTLIEAEITNLPIYKIYSRGDHQGNEELKHTRKVRLKFNQYFGDRNKQNGSLWTVPDIIGFTIVVTYPSDINSVCKVIDSLIDKKRLVATTVGIVGAQSGGSPVDRLREADSERQAKALIDSRFGRAIVTDGYFACHYNVRTKAVGSQRPICEVQIKTVLHDAWGAKSHDLTYKPSGRTNQELIDSFNLLGDTLAKIDQQSDLVRRSIERTSLVREAKKRQIQITLISSASRATSNRNPELISIVDRIEACGVDEKSEALEEIVTKLHEFFDENQRFVCLALCLLSVRTKSSIIFEEAQETIEIWYEGLSNNFERISARSFAALASYSAGDVSGAIEAAEQAVELIDKFDANELPDADQTRLAKLANSTLTSLAYYHADRIGSHDGKIGRSHEMASAYLDKSVKYREIIGLLPNGLDSTETEIEDVLKDKSIGFTAFSTLDNEAFVRIQTADTEEKLRFVRKKLEFLHKERPSKWTSTASLLFDYHEYCARARLAELEVG